MTLISSFSEPLYCLSIILWNTTYATRIHQPLIELSRCMTLISSFSEPLNGLSIVLWHTFALEIYKA